MRAHSSDAAPRQQQRQRRGQGRPPLNPHSESEYEYASDSNSGGGGGGSGSASSVGASLRGAQRSRRQRGRGAGGESEYKSEYETDHQSGPAGSSGSGSEYETDTASEPEEEQAGGAVAEACSVLVARAWAVGGLTIICKWPVDYLPLDLDQSVGGGGPRGWGGLPGVHGLQNLPVCGRAGSGPESGASERALGGKAGQRLSVEIAHANGQPEASVRAPPVPPDSTPPPHRHPFAD